MKNILWLLVFLSCNNAPEQDNTSKKEYHTQEVVVKKPEMIFSWSGYLSNNIIKLLNADVTLTQEEILMYAKMTYSQSKPYQNINLYYYHGNAPKNISIPQFEQTNPQKPKTTGMNGVLEFVKSTSPFLTIKILGENEFVIKNGFEY